MSQRALIHQVILSLKTQNGKVEINDFPPDSRIKEWPAINFVSNDTYVPRQMHSNSKAATITAKNNSFVYMDVGVWADKEYNFGLVCQSCVWLCKFNYSVNQGEIHGNTWKIAPDLLKKFHSHFKKSSHSFNVSTFAEILKNSPKEDVLYVFLPDMHLPAIQYKDEFQNTTESERQQFARDYRKLMEMTFEEKRAKYPWRPDYNSAVQNHKYRRYQAYTQSVDADIFKNAGKSLEAFLRIIISFISDNKLFDKIKIIQIGDMYELWQGMAEWGTFLDKTPHGEVLESDAVVKLTNRIQEIESQNLDLIRLFSVLEGYGVMTYLYGNHDVYLIDILRNKDKKWDAALGTQKPRIPCFYYDNIFAEHGHRFDYFNQDGSWSGAFITELVFHLPFIRYFDPDRTGMYHLKSAIDFFYQSYLEKKPTFGVYVMGHTHKCSLSTINIYKYPLELSDRYPSSKCNTCG